jgi:hypothetical protein
MANLILNGSTSGSVTLSSPAVSGTTTLTLPTTTGTIVVTSGAQTIEFADGSASTPSITNSGDTNTGIFFSAADTIDFAEGGTACGQFDSSANFKFNSGYGSVATAYGCRAWVNFNGQGTVAIRASGNVSSITDNGTGDYTVNFTTAMPDANYSVVASGRGDENINRGAGLMIDIPKYTVAPTTAAISLRTGIGATAVNNGVLHDSDFVFVSVFR